jgi:hypothetical protein
VVVRAGARSAAVSMTCVTTPDVRLRSRRAEAARVQLHDVGSSWLPPSHVAAVASREPCCEVEQAARAIARANLL